MKFLSNLQKTIRDTRMRETETIEDEGKDN